MGVAQADRSLSRSLPWQWKLLLPLFALILIVTMVGAYALMSGADVDTTNQARAQLGRLLLALLAGGLVIAIFVATNAMLVRVTRVTRVVQMLASGQKARTGLRGTDEISVLGQAIDRYADQVEDRQDALRATLRRQRREVSHLTSVLEALPDGIVVQDLDGHVVLINDRARELLGAERVVRTSTLNEVTAVVTDVLGPALAPGLYALGDPRRVECDGRMLRAQAAVLTSVANQRVGTVIVLHDITEEVRRERAHDALLNRLAKDVQTPMAASHLNGESAASVVAQEMARHAVALQKLIVEMRDLTADLDQRQTVRGQRAILLDTFVWAVANEWRQVAQAANLKLDVHIEQSGLYILGDELRLRWAIGNLVDNAIKYTPPGGSITLEIRGEVNGMAHLRLRDDGSGISADDLPHVFTRFYRGKPVTESGRVIRVPGSGQGLSVTKQIVEACGGSIRIKSSPGVGTAVYISLPLTAPVRLELTHGQLADMEGETVRIVPHRHA